MIVSSKAILLQYTIQFPNNGSTRYRSRGGKVYGEFNKKDAQSNGYRR